jgi:phosphoserine phosphatase
VRRFKSVVIDVDSTLSGIEGIDWLAALRGSELEEWSASLTAKAMDGIIAVEAVYSERMKAVKPTRSELEALSRAYVERAAPRSREVIAALSAAEVDVVLVSGGLREAILPLATELGIQADRVNAVSVYFDKDGNYAGYEEDSPLTRQNGKRVAVRQLNLEGPTLAVGDGMTDCQIRPVVDGFAAYTGFVRRAPVIKQADYVLEDFDQLEELVLR